MKTLGLDIGTTTISAVILENDTVLDVRNEKNDSFLSGQQWERIQDPERILRISQNLVEEFLEKYPDTAAIGVTGQMHGILYLDGDGNSVSPLYTWQDGRGDQAYDAEHTWASMLSNVTKYPLATGYGMVTHAYNIGHGLVPDTAKKLCTIMDYVAMNLAGNTEPGIDPTNGASLGLFCLETGCFDRMALHRAGIDAEILPNLVSEPCLGTGMLGIPVYGAIGDNQASFLGATGGRQDAVLINVGTGSQVSVYSDRYLKTAAMETRPYPGGWLLVGAPLCGGSSYALLERFFRQTVKMVTGNEESAYSAMEQALEEAVGIGEIPLTVTTFRGTRKNPALRGSIQGISMDNFTPVHLINSFLYGMAEELFGYYREFLDLSGKQSECLIGSGNGLRKNRHLCRIMETVFGCRLILSEREEEAACGAAMYAAGGMGK